ncbi:hypothetical protein KIN20_009426 [Parelaphostrongylus tenuis]|uniref:Uncharacterized protein n=1 Tax=Parelaphostrongylus tenuis TaxID=148309 RepID=A0AAD5M6D2_PARTN|nr:hypothetical protein KIN20_009426 [Parelaphostrongylus tenuis]
MKSALCGTRITDVRLVARAGNIYIIQCDGTTETNYFRLEADNARLSVTVNQVGDTIAVDWTKTEEAVQVVY